MILSLASTSSVFPYRPMSGMMDGIKSWSAFEQQQRENDASSSGPSSAAAAAQKTIGEGINALYVSSSSPDIAPAAAALLRHSGLTAPSNSSRVSGDTTCDSADSQRKDDDEFRLRFHWMRPHPSLAYALEEGSSSQTQNATKVHDNPAVEATKLVEAYRSSQINKLLDVTPATNSEDKDDGDQEGDSGKSCKEKGAEPKSNIPTDKINKANPNLPLELPKLRINLASLVEPPLMSSWLPGEDIGVSYESEEERDNMDEDK